MASSANRILPAASAPQAHQQLVDLVQAQIRSGPMPAPRSLFKPAPPGPGRSGEVLDERIAEELDLVVRQLERLGDTLSGDPVLLHRYATQLQSVDLMQQVLGHLSRIVASADKAMAVDQVTLTTLKARLTRSALRSIAGRDR
jgi:hypothetical protein